MAHRDGRQPPLTLSGTLLLWKCFFCRPCRALRNHTRAHAGSPKFWHSSTTLNGVGVALIQVRCMLYHSAPSSCSEPVIPMSCSSQLMIFSLCKCLFTLFFWSYEFCAMSRFLPESFYMFTAPDVRCAPPAMPLFPTSETHQPFWEPQLVCQNWDFERWKNLNIKGKNC